ncbi:MAG: DUF2723 domain-containing protein [Bacteroidaceae bacterium]|nr:DUF2723 domain-containing protein [Bacteroidaceae bacterium]
MKQFRFLNNTLGWFTFLIAAITYCTTVEPTASFWDCPEFILSGNKLEIGHPPGAPFFMLTANFFSLFAGPEKVALMVNIMSAILSALGILFLFWSITHLTRKLIVGNSYEMTGSQMITILASGLVGALAYTWSDTYWFSAVEGEVYGYSSLFTAVVFWLILKWEENASSPHSDRWLILIAYLVGLSIGVHLLNLLCIPAIVLVIYYKKFPDANWKGSLKALIVSGIIVAAVLYGIVPGVVKVGGWFELLFVNVLGMPFNTGLFIYMILLAAVLVAGVFYSQKGEKHTLAASLFTGATALLGIPFYGHSVTSSIIIGVLVLVAIYIATTRSKNITIQEKRQSTTTTAKRYLVSFRALNTAFLCMLLIMIGYSSYALIVIRSAANTPMDQNSPEDIFTLGTYLNREQYGTRPLLWGQGFDSEMKIDHAKRRYDSVDTSPIYSKVEKKSAGEPDRYEIIGYNKEYKYVQNMLFPRMYSDQHAHLYEKWSGPITNLVPAENYEYTGKQYVKMPTQWDNLRFFINYQVNHMYWRYFLWNFVGRQNDIQSRGEIEYGNWITGFPFIDTFLTGNQSLAPTDLKENKGRNVFFALPLILGILGLVWQYRRGKEGKQQFWVVFMLFFMTGLAIVLYLNQTPNQPRERDYAYAGSFYAFAIWIGMGVAALAQYIKDLKKKDSLGMNIAVAAACLLVPLQMVSQTWDDHDRSGRYACRDFGQNYLNSMPVKGCPIIFTCGDNDTFPLWYNQEVEGERTDARVCNLSYLQTDWYIDQMRRPAYDSPSLPITWERIDYAGNANGSVEIIPIEDFIEGYRNANPEKFRKAFGENPYEMNKITNHWILEADDTEKSFARGVVEEIISQYERALNKMRTERGYESIKIPRKFIPTSTILIPIDGEAVKRSGMMIPQEYADSMPKYMEIELDDIVNNPSKGGLHRYELIMFDMLANANWERPIYMSMTVGTDNYPAVLQNFFVHEGLAYRITPFNWRKLGYESNGDAPVDMDIFYDNVMNRFKWGGVKENKDYYADETVRRMIYTHRNLLANLAQTMFYSGADDTKVMNVLEKWHEEFPGDIIPYDAVRDNSITVANIYSLLYHKQHYDKENNGKSQLDAEAMAVLEERAYEVASAIVKEQFEYLRWYNTLNARSRSDIMAYTRASLLREAWSIIGNSPIGNIDSGSIADEVAKYTYKECELLKQSDASLLENTKAVETKLQLIASLHKFLGEMANSKELDMMMTSSLEHISKFADRKLKRYNVNRLSEGQKQEILSTLRLLGTVREMAGRIKDIDEKAMLGIYGTYNTNLEKFAPHVLN